MPIYSLSATQKANWDGDYIFGCAGLDKTTKSSVKKILNKNDIDYTFNKNGWVFSKDQLSSVENCLKEYLKPAKKNSHSLSPRSTRRAERQNNSNTKKQLNALQKAFDKVQVALDECYDKLEELSRSV